MSSINAPVSTDGPSGLSDRLVAPLLAVFLILSVMTTFRSEIFSISVAELVLTAWGTLLVAGGVLLRLNLRFITAWVIFLFAALLGYAWNPAPDNAMAAHNALAFIYCAGFSVLLQAYLQRANTIELRKLVHILLILAVVIYFACTVLVLSGWSWLISLLGINQFYPNRLSGWSSNPNQLSLFFTGLPLLILWYCEDAPTKAQRLWMLLLAGIFFVGMCQRSDALLLSWAVSIFALFLMSLLPGIKLSRLTTTAALSLLVATWLVFKSLPEIIITSLDLPPEYLASQFGVGLGADKGQVRLMLWKSGLQAWKDAPFFGLGPGAYSSLPGIATHMEAHNIVIDLLTQTGLAGTLTFMTGIVFLALQAIKRRKPHALALLMVTGIFSMAHFTFRMPILWFYIMFAAWMVGNTDSNVRNNRVLDTK